MRRSARKPVLAEVIYMGAVPHMTTNVTIMHKDRGG